MNIQSRRLIKFSGAAFRFRFQVRSFLCAALAGTDIVYPTPETQSTFIKDYTPTEVLARFSLEGSQQSGPVDPLPVAGAHSIRRSSCHCSWWLKETNPLSWRQCDWISSLD